MEGVTNPQSAAWAEERRARVLEAHVAELNALVQTWRAEDPERSVPWFDPADGGTTASVLLLLESPAPSTTSPTGSHLCSEDNTDATNRLLRSRRLAAGLPRSACVKWNAVPWASAAPHRAPDLARAASRLRGGGGGPPRGGGGRWKRGPRTAGRGAAAAPPRPPPGPRGAPGWRLGGPPPPRLQVVITFGGTAAAVLATASTQADPPVLLPALAVPHPSQRNTRARQEALERIDRALTCAAGLVSGPLAQGSTGDRPSAPDAGTSDSARS